MTLRVATAMIALTGLALFTTSLVIETGAAKHPVPGREAGVQAAQFTYGLEPYGDPELQLLVIRSIREPYPEPEWLLEPDEALPQDAWVDRQVPDTLPGANATIQRSVLLQPITEEVGI